MTEWNKKYITVNGLRLAYVERGTGPSVMFVHGNPTSSYLWRNILPAVSHSHRRLALDLLGMGDSAKLPQSGADSYTLSHHQEYFDAAMDQLVGDDPVILVLHDWGSALGFDWARRNAEAVEGIAYMEAIVCPVGWSELPCAAKSIFRGFRSPAGEELVLTRNLFVEKVLPASILRTLTEEEMHEYRRPFRIAGESRRPTLTWPRQIPIDGEPPEVVDVVQAYGEWLESCDVPKLFINADPGCILTGRQREYCRGWPNQAEVTVRGIHFLQEDSPAEIGDVLAEWLRNLA